MWSFTLVMGNPLRQDPPADARYLKVSSAYRTPLYQALYRQWSDEPRTPSGWPAHPSWPTPSTASTDWLSASSSRASTQHLSPWLTSPDMNSRGRPGGRPRKMRLSPCLVPGAIVLRSRVPACALAVDGRKGFAAHDLRTERGDTSRYGRRSLPPTLYRLAIRQNSTASGTHRSGSTIESRATTAALGVPVLDPGNSSPHLAPLFPARRPQVSAPERIHTRNGSTRLRDAATREEGCAMKPWLNVGEGAEYAGLSRDTIYTACERKELRHARAGGSRTAGRGQDVRSEDRS